MSDIPIHNDSASYQLTKLMIANGKAKATRKVLDGKTYWVTPASILVEGVLEGSDGAIFYPAEENTKNPSIWNKHPLTAGHPTHNGQPATAHNPDVLSKVGMGFFDNAKAMKGGKIRGEAWFEEEATKRVDIGIYNDLRAGRPIELSTGLLLRKTKAPEGSNYNGKPYGHVASDYKPDHIAVLRNSKGACSIKDGCGILVNQGDTLVANEALCHAEVRRQLTELIDKKYGRVNGLEPYSYVYIEDVFDKKVIYSKGRDLYELGYSKNNKTGVVALSSDVPVKVRKVVSYKSVENTDVVNETSTSNDADQVSKGVDLQNDKGKTMDREAIINELVTNCNCWKGENDKEVLNGFSDEKLTELKKQLDKNKNLEAVANAAKKGFESQEGHKYTFNENTQKWEGKPVEKKPEPTPVNNGSVGSEQDRLTQEEREDLAFARNQRNKMKQEIVDVLVANVANENKAQVADFLMKKSLDDLEVLKQIQPPAAPVVNEGNLPSWFGASGGPTTPVKNHEPEPLVANTISFKQERDDRGRVRAVAN